MLLASVAATVDGAPNIQHPTSFFYEIVEKNTKQSAFGIRYSIFDYSRFASYIQYSTLGTYLRSFSQSKRFSTLCTLRSTIVRRYQ